MKSFVRFALGVATLLLLYTAGASVVSAYQLIASPKELTTSPLLLTGYQRSGDKTLRYLQLYNNGDEPIDLNQWTVRLNGRQVSTDANANILPTVEGYLLPTQHIIFSVPTETFQFGALPLAKSQTNASLTDIAIYPPQNTLLTTEFYDLTNKPTELLGPMQREATSRNTYNAAFKPKQLLTSSNWNGADYLYYSDSLYVPAASSRQLQIVEIYPYGQDCSPLDENILCRDYVKLYNPTIETVDLSDYALRSDSGSTGHTAANTVRLEGLSIGPGQYLSISRTNALEALSLTNSGGYVWLEDVWGLALYDETVTSYDGAGVGERGKSWAQNDDGVWRWTSRPQPDGPNMFDVAVLDDTDEVPAFTECPAGKYRNPETNRCRTIEEAVNALAACPEGQVRNPVTNRCRSLSAASSALVPCKEGQERNPETNRCRSIASAVAELIPCDEGYERNPATNRCRKTVPGVSLANPASVPVAESRPANTSQTLLIAAIGASAVAYAVYEWRSELWRFIRRIIPGIRA